MNKQPDERLIQRVIDNECSAAERQTLMQQLDESPEGWKTLACGFLEDQLFASAAVAPGIHPPAAQPAPQVKRAPRMAWLSHPMTTRILTASVMFLVGFLVSRQATSEATAPSSEVQAALRPPYAESDEAMDVPNATYASNRMLVKAGNQEPQELDVYDNPLQFISALEQMRAQGQRLGVQNMPHAKSRIRYLHHVTDDGQLILVPVSEVQFEYHIH